MTAMGGEDDALGPSARHGVQPEALRALWLAPLPWGDHRARGPGCRRFSPVRVAAPGKRRPWGPLAVPAAARRLFGTLQMPLSAVLLGIQAGRRLPRGFPPTGYLTGCLFVDATVGGPDREEEDRHRASRHLASSLPRPPAAMTIPKKVRLEDHRGHLRPPSGVTHGWSLSLFARKEAIGRCQVAAALVAGPAGPITGSFAVQAPWSPLR